jgi:uncharacterized membrane protein
MVVYHGAYDIIYMFGFNIPIFHSPLVRLAQPFVAGIFVFISGMACRFSRSNLKRGCLTLLAGLGMSGVTLFILPLFSVSQPIYFGILHLLGTGMLLFAALERKGDSLTPIPGMLLCLILFAVTLGVGEGRLGIGPASISLPAALNGIRWLLPLGFYGAGSDYFPLLPWIFLFYAGSYMGVPFARQEALGFFYRSHIPALSAVGRYTIFIYLLHQPVLYGVLSIVLRIVL